MGRNSKKLAVSPVTEISSTQDTSNMNAISQVSRIAIDAADLPATPVARTAIEACYYPVNDTMSGGYCLDSVLCAATTANALKYSQIINNSNHLEAIFEADTVRTAIEACYYPVEDTMSGGYCLDSGLNGPATVARATDVFPNPYFLRLLAEVSTATVSLATIPAPPVPVHPLDAYTGKPVSLAYFVGIDPETNKEVLHGFATVNGERAEQLAVRAFKAHNLVVVVSCAETMVEIYRQGKKKSSSTVKGGSKPRANGKVAKIAHVETEEEKAIRLAAEKKAFDEAWDKAIDEAEELNAAFDESKLLDKAKVVGAFAENQSKLLTALRNAPLHGTEDRARWDGFTRQQGMTPKEANYAWNARNSAETGKIANFGWKQIAEKLVSTYVNYILVQSARPCEASASEGKMFIGPAFRIMPANEEIPAGWYRIK